MTRPRITLIAAMDRQGVIGHAGGMPWHIPEDLRWFKRNTQGKGILMGRATFDSIGRALPKRRNIVLTRQKDWSAEGVVVVHDLEQALAQTGPGGELMVIGGEKVFQQILPMADQLTITFIEASYTGDTRFPEVAWQEWALQEEIPHAATEQAPAYRFMIYTRQKDNRV